MAFPRFCIDIDAEQVYRTLAEEHEVFVVPGRVFDWDNRYFRLGFGSLESHVREGLHRLDLVVEHLRSDRAGARTAGG